MALATDPAVGLFSVTPSDATVVYARGLYVGGAGNIAIVAKDDDAPQTLVGVLAGTVLPIQVKQVYSTGTTATNIIGLK